MSSNKCQVCGPDGGDGLPKYKCPTCYIKYCSVACFKKHKETPCQKPEGPVAGPRGPGVNSVKRKHEVSRLT